MNILLIASDRELRAGARVLRSLLHHDHPMVRRAVDEALNDCTREQAIRFTARCEASLLGQVPMESAS